MGRTETLAVKTILQENGFDTDLKKVTQSIKDNRVEYQNAEAKAKAFGTETDRLSAKQIELARNMVAQKTKVKTLNKALDEAKRKHGENSEVTKKLATDAKKAETQFYKYAGQLKGTKGALDKAAKAEDKVGDKAQKMGKKIKKASTQTKGLKAGLKSFASSSIGQFASVMGAVMLIKKAFKALWDTVTGAAKYADEMNTLSKITGVSVDKLQEFNYASKFLDVNLSTITGSLKKLSRNMYEASIGTKQQKDAFAELSISYEDGNGNLRDNQEVFYEMIDALGKMTDETKRDAIGMVLLGRSATDLNPLIKAGGEALKGYGKEAEDLGIVLDASTIAILQKLQDQIDKTENITKAQGQKMAANMAPVVGEVEKLKAAAANMPLQWFKNWKNIGQMIGGASVADIISYEEVESAAYAASLSIEEYDDRVMKLATDLQVATIANGEMMTTEEAIAGARLLTIEGLDAQAYAVREATAAQTEFDAAINISLSSYQAKNEEYITAVELRANQFATQMGGVFGAFPATLDKSEKELKTVAEKMLLDVQNTNTGFRGWSDGLAKLAKRGVDEGLIAEMELAGPKAAEKIKALNSMSDEELKIWVTTARENAQMFREQADKELELMKAEVEARLQNVQDAIDAKEEGMKEVGKKLGSGIVDGVEEALSGLESQVVSKVNAAIRAANAAASSATSGSNTQSESGPLGIPSYGTGTVATSPHVALVGDEPEVIVPLNNRSRSRKLLDYANAKMGGGGQRAITQHINIEINGYSEGDARRIVQEINNKLGEYL